MSRLNERPIVFALSNPTSKAECTAQEAYEFSRGKAIYASGSPFPPYTYEGKTLVPGQGNNAYVFPGIGLGVVACQAKHVTDRMFMAAAKALAGEVQQSDLDMGRMYPSLTRIQEVSLTIAVAVAQVAYEDGLARAKKPANLRSFIKAQMWVPKYLNYV
jgi:malate dehydrogenase (oxaloacetate-decarboxylating)(NADP+)